MKRNKIKNILLLISGIGILAVGTYLGNSVSDAAVMDTKETELREEIIPSEGIKTNDADNIYVELNNQLVEAIDDYANGKITKEEYLEICDSVNKQIDSKREFNELKESEYEFKSEN